MKTAVWIITRIITETMGVCASDEKGNPDDKAKEMIKDWTVKAYSLDSSVWPDLGPKAHRALADLLNELEKNKKNAFPPSEITAWCVVQW